MDLILNNSCSVSSITSQYSLNKQGIIIKKVQFVLIKKDIPTIDFSNLTIVCIDDFDIKKRHTYGTIMIHHQNKKIVDMIP